MFVLLLLPLLMLTGCPLEFDAVNDWSISEASSTLTKISILACSK
jgi:hypothetical protein